jgi:hypothetical protein
MEWYRGWYISKSFFGYCFQHPGYDPERVTDWRYGTATNPQEARDEIDRLLAEAAAISFDCADCNSGAPEQCMKASYCAHREAATP